MENEKLPIQLIDPSLAKFNSQNKIYRDGVELEKGVLVSEEWLINHEQFLLKQIEFFTAYPDLFLDLITPPTSSFTLFPYQRVFLRGMMRYTKIYITAARATAKTFLAILGKLIQCILIPNHVGSIVAPNKTQAAKIFKQKIDEVFRLFPLLEREVKKYNAGKDYIYLEFRNKSQLSIVGALDSDRGIRTHATFLDEVRDIDGDMVREVILPQMNVSRRQANGLVNPYEKINTQVVYATSAGSKSSFAYEQLLDVFETSIINPQGALCFGLDYRIPVMHGLIDRNYVNDLKLSPSYTEATFAAEYGSLWQGGSEDSWFDFEKLERKRIIKNPEWRKKYDDPNVFYLIGVDVGRISDQTVATIFRVNIRGNRFYSTMVNIFVLGTRGSHKTFDEQSIQIKRLIRDFEPREVIVDTNGLGIGLADILIKPQIDEKGEAYPAYGFHNDKVYAKIQPKDAPQILYSMKANATLNSEIHGNAYTRISSGLINFLITEQEARSLLLGTKKGQRMSYENRTKRLMPHEMTTKLFQEMSNLRIKKTGLNITLEQINTRFPKDKYSSFAYAQWRIKELEDQYSLKNRNQSRQNRQLIFFSGGA